VVSSGASILLKNKRNFSIADAAPVPVRISGASATSIRNESHRPFLRVPPFPDARIREFTRVRPDDDADGQRLAEALLEARVGGAYWAAQPHLPENYVLVRSRGALGEARRIARGKTVLLWEQEAEPSNPAGDAVVVSGDCDPWHMLSRASALLIEAGDELQLIAALLKVPCHLFDPASSSVKLAVANAPRLAAETFGDCFANPFTGESMNALAAIELCGFWRRLIDSNRDIAGGIGFAFWKQAQVAPLLWGGSSPFRFLRGRLPATESATAIAAWRSKAGSQLDAELERRNIALVEVEDGFLRSRGLGADCVPPLSITVDRMGAHFDPARPSELEQLLEDGRFDDALLERARKLLRLIVDKGIGKYESGAAHLERPAGERRHILVPGQVEDDRAVQTGGCGLVSNLDLLARVRAQAPEAYILYKPHPDVVAGHRRGSVADAECLRFADEIVGALPIASLIAMVDEVHVNTSLAGFEALLRGKAVVTHGVPFYAGWGLTRDLGPVPARRMAKRTVDELVAAALLLYPRYLDPVTGLPCPAEVLVARLIAAAEPAGDLVVGIRRFQGRLMRRLRSLVQ